MAFDFFGGAVEQRYKSEREWLESIADRTKEWYNELLDGLGGILYAIETEEDDRTLRKRFSKTAQRMYNEWHKHNSGNDLASLSIRIGKRGVPFFTERKLLKSLIDDYLNSGAQLKKVAAILGSSVSDSPAKLERARREIKKVFAGFRARKDALLEHVDAQLAQLG